MDYILLGTEHFVELAFQHTSERKTHHIIGSPRGTDNRGLFISANGNVQELGFTILVDDKGMYTEDQIQVIRQELFNSKVEHLHDWVLRDVTARYLYLTVIVVAPSGSLMYAQGDWRPAHSERENVLLYNGTIHPAVLNQLRNGKRLSEIALSCMYADPQVIIHEYLPEGRS